ncbi:MAG: aminoacyl-tRNA hydrolase [Lachnospiraceae bacterium]|nr:aminoacyl-tRNA hydrolase [Lachnospiraceae bacterium]
MYLIVGLGNPSREYAGTRHNVGFEVVNILADRFDIATDYIKHKAICGKGMIEGNKVMLAMPQTFMNLSGDSVGELVSYYRIDVASELIVVYDDVALEPGRIRIRKSGSAGGHNGMKNIISRLGTEEFMRVRVGVGEKPKGYDLADYVLGHFSKDERELMDIAFIDAANAVVSIMNDGIDAAMNRFNTSKKENDESI